MIDLLATTADEVFPIDYEDVDRARIVGLERQDLSARDALHAAVMQRHGVAHIMSFDAGFDRLPGVSRLS